MFESQFGGYLVLFFVFGVDQCIGGQLDVVEEYFVEMFVIGQVLNWVNGDVWQVEIDDEL